jgi:hypothetical protein
MKSTPVHHKTVVDPITVSEHVASSFRIASEELDRLTFGPVRAIVTASAVIFAIGTAEGYTQLRPVTTTVAKPQQWGSRTKFILRYAGMQIIPSVIWDTQPAATIAKHIHFDLSQLYSRTDMPTAKILRINRLTAFRGAVAGGVLLSQVLSLTNLLQQCRSRYSERIFAGKEPPLACTYEQNEEPGVVIRLAGIESDVTNYSMALMGRRKLWPIFEYSKNCSVKSLVREHATSDHHPAANVPIYWQVNDRQYSRPDSWLGMYIPKTWLFETKRSSSENESSRLLIIEADVTPGDGSSFMDRDHYLSRDLDLREVGQAFHCLASLAPEIGRDEDNKIKRLSPGAEIEDPRVLRVLLVDQDAKVEGGGGALLSVREFVSELCISDVVINSRAAVVHSLISWLNGAYADTSSKPTTVMTLSKSWKKNPVILETHSREWFVCIHKELGKHGFEVIDRHDVSAEDAKAIPMLVFERTSADTVYRVRALVKAGITRPEKVCALLEDHGGLEKLRALKMTQVSFLCPSLIYHNAFAFVRRRAMEGSTPSEIQRDLDSGRLWEDFDEFQF